MGIVLLLALLWARIHSVWTYENINTYVGELKFSFWNRRRNSNLSPKQISANKRRNRLIVLCALTIGFVVSVTEAVSKWSDDMATDKYEGLIQLDM